MSQPLAGKVVILGITGSIAAYKAADIASRLVKLGAEVHPVMTAAAQKFITPLTLQTISRQTVGSDMWEKTDGWKPGHIELADRAHLMLVAPATADMIGLFANGLAPDLLSSIYLMARCPVLVAPAMNGKMWLHAATQANVTTLLNRGVQFIGPESGMLACGYEGVGRLWPVEGIVEKAVELLTAKQ